MNENTMLDLKEEVQTRLRNALHGREIDERANDVRLPHMLGITPIGKVHDPKNEDMTLLDPEHPFWSSYHEDVSTANEVVEKVETAVRLLKEDGAFRITYPYGEDADISYTEVDDVRQKSSYTVLCDSCDGIASASLDIEHRGSYTIVVDIFCEDCGNISTHTVRLGPHTSD